MRSPRPRNSKRPWGSVRVVAVVPLRRTVALAAGSFPTVTWPRNVGSSAFRRLSENDGPNRLKAELRTLGAGSSPEMASSVAAANRIRHTRIASPALLARQEIDDLLFAQRGGGQAKHGDQDSAAYKQKRHGPELTPLELQC